MADRFKVHTGDRVKHMFTFQEGIVKRLYGLRDRNIQVLWDNDTVSFVKEYEVFVEVNGRFTSINAISV